MSSEVTKLDDVTLLANTTLLKHESCQTRGRLCYGSPSLWLGKALGRRLAEGPT